MARKKRKRNYALEYAALRSLLLPEENGFFLSENFCPSSMTSLALLNSITLASEDRKEKIILMQLQLWFVTS